MKNVIAALVSLISISLSGYLIYSSATSPLPPLTSSSIESTPTSTIDVPQLDPAQWTALLRKSLQGNPVPIQKPNVEEQKSPQVNLPTGFQLTAILYMKPEETPLVWDWTIFTEERSMSIAQFRIGSETRFLEVGSEIVPGVELKSIGPKKVTVHFRETEFELLTPNRGR